jgi:hypothetical protein
MVLSGDLPLWSTFLAGRQLARTLGWFLACSSIYRHETGGGHHGD